MHYPACPIPPVQYLQEMPYTNENMTGLPPKNCQIMNGIVVKAKTQVREGGPPYYASAVYWEVLHAQYVH